jgi:DNA polymerase-3 subunit gamma/tau
MSQALYRKWRPHLWEKVVGQDHIVQTLKNAIRSNRVGHAYLFSGPRGTGKTTSARLLAKAVNCLHEDINQRPCNECEHCVAVNAGRFMDLIEIDAASNTSVDDVRDLREKIGFSPTQGRFKVYIIDEVHMLSTAAFNALLKTLEEPPPHAIFILATTEVHKIPATVLSRCQRHEFRRIPVTTIVSYLKKMIADEPAIVVDEEVLLLIARQSTGAMRDAISLLDQLASTGERISLEAAQQVLGTATHQAVIDLMEAILAKNTAAGLDCIHLALDTGTDPRQFARQVVEYLRGLLLVRMGNAEHIDVTNEQRAVMTKQAKSFELPALMAAVRLFNSAANESRLAWQPSLALELALAQSMLEPQSEADGSAVSTAEMNSQRAIVKKGKGSQKPNTPDEEAELEVVFGKKDKKEAVLPVLKEEAQEEVVEVETGSTDHSAAFTAAQLREAIPEVRQLIRKYRKNTEALLASAKSFTLKKGVIVIGFNSPVLKERMEKGDHQEIIQRAFSHVLRGDARVRAVIERSKNIIGDLDEDFPPDSVVGAALDLGGQIVDKE